MLNSVRKRRLVLVILIMMSALLAVFLVVCALRQNMNFFFTPSQIENGEAKTGTRIRLGGMVRKGSLIRKEGLEVQFQLTDLVRHVTVTYSGILPDLFKEGQGAVVLGTLTNKNIFQADEVLAKHDENYMPPELSGMVQNKDN